MAAMFVSRDHRPNTQRMRVSSYSSLLSLGHKCNKLNAETVLVVGQADW